MYVICPANELIELLSNPMSMSSTAVSMAHECGLRQIQHPRFRATIQAHNAFSLQLVKLVAEFTQQLSHIHEQQAEDLQVLVETFRKRNAELRQERPLLQSNLFTSWETFLQEVEVDSQIHSDIASTLGRQVSIPLLEKTFHQKVQSRKVFTHRESYETILSKTEELLLKCHKDYNEAYQRLLHDQSSANMAAYYDAHNAYIQQLHAANAMIDEYHSETLPHLLDELEDVYLSLSDTITKSILDGARVIATKAAEQQGRYNNLCDLAKGVAGKTDLSNYIRALGADKAPPENILHNFKPPRIEMDANEIPDLQYIPMLKDEILMDRNTLPVMRDKYEALQKEVGELDLKIRQLQEALESLVRVQQRSLENCLFNKANELQEDISLKRFDLRVAQIHLAAVRAQIDLLAVKVDERAANNGRDRKMSSSSTGSIKNKWLKAIKSLKTGGGEGSKQSKDSGKGELSASPFENSHLFQEYTFKKITACDLCKEILRGNTRQGLRCKMCKVNIHVECQHRIGKCNPKSRLLRRQKSTSELESRVMERSEEDSMHSSMRLRERGPLSFSLSKDYSH